MFLVVVFSFVFEIQEYNGGWYFAGTSIKYQCLISYAWMHIMFSEIRIQLVHHSSLG